MPPPPAASLLGRQKEHSMTRRTLAAALLLAALAACGPRPPAALPTPTPISTPIPGTLYVDPQRDLGPISPHVYGSNFGPWTAVPMGMMDYALDSHITALRFPGGEWGDANDLRPFQVDQFIAFCRQIEAVPTISVRLLGGTPEAAAQLVRYANIDQGYDVRIWSIGNEPTLYEDRPNVDYDTVRFNREWRAIAEAMKAVDPDIILLGPELHGTFTSDFASNPKDVNGLDWMTEFLKANGDMVDVVTYHRYPFPLQRTGPNATIEQLRGDAPEWTRTVRYLRQLIRETTGGELPIGVTEAGSHYSPAVLGEATPDSLYNAIWWSDVLGRLINENVWIVNQWVFTTSTGQAGGLGLIAHGRVRPTYYVYQMYARFGTRRLYAASGIPDVSIYAARDSDGALTLMVVNLSDAEQRAPLEVRGEAPAEAGLWLLDESHSAEDLGRQPIPSDGALLLPARSVSLYRIGP
jgi:hypothetical protein